MTATDIIRIVVSVGTVQLICDLIANWRIFNDQTYQRALSALSRSKVRLDKEQLLSSGEVLAGATSTSSIKKADKHAKRLKRAEDDHAEAKAAVAKLHAFPSFLTSIVFLIVLRVLGTEFRGSILGIIPFPPFSFLRRLTARGLVFDNDLLTDAAALEIGTERGCSFMLIYALSSLSIKFYVSKLFGTSSPSEGGDFMSILESPASQRMMKAAGIDPNDLKVD